MIKVVEKGYTLKVVSWENDGDQYNTKSVVLEDKECAKIVAKTCKELFASGSNNSISIGNGQGNSEKRIEAYFEKNPILPKKLWENQEEVDVRMLIDFIGDELLGYSEFYDHRVCESVSLTYSSEDIILEEIEF